MPIKHVTIVLSGLVVPAPDALLDAGKHGRIVVLRGPIGPKIVWPPRRPGIASRRLKPRVLGRSVLDNQLNNHPQPQLPGAGNQLNHVGDGPETGIGLQMVADIIAIILQWGEIERGQPEHRRPQATNVVQLLAYTGKIAKPIAVGVVKQSTVNLIDDRSVKPLFLLHHYHLAFCPPLSASSARPAGFRARFVDWRYGVVLCRWHPVRHRVHQRLLPGG